MRARILLLCATLLCFSGCTTLQPTPATESVAITLSQLIPVNQVVDLDSATKALVMAQDFRVFARNSVAKSVRLGVRPKTDLDKFEAYDQYFRSTFRVLKVYVDRWRLTDDSQLGLFKSDYVRLLEQAITLETVKESTP